jgi:predicted RNase H-like nuclease (RuvC/YqgF family)
VDNTELKSTLDRNKRESRQEIEKLRGEVCRLMEDNHRYSRDLDRLLKENSDIKDKLSAATHRQELSHQNL